MKTLAVVKYKQQLDALFSKVEAATGDDLELQSHWAKYLCVLISGFIETAVREILKEYAKNKSSSNVSNFVANRLNGFQNPNMQKILEIVGAFSPEWQAMLETETEGQPKHAIDSIVANRHRISHGQPSAISLAQIKEYYKGALQVIEHLEKICYGGPLRNAVNDR